jgi:hypothetical protein
VTLLLDTQPVVITVINDFRKVRRSYWLFPCIANFSVIFERYQQFLGFFYFSG